MLARTRLNAAARRGLHTKQRCLEIVRDRDRPAYLASLLLPEHSRRGFWAVRALNAELAMVAERAGGNPATAQLRFQWWRDLVAYACDPAEDPVSQTKAHPIAVELRRAVQNQNLTRRWLDRLINAREDEMGAPQPRTLSDLEDYSEATASSLVYLALELAGVRDDHADHAASHLGKSMGIATSLASIPVLHALGKIRLPQDLMNKHGLRRRAFVAVADASLTTGKPAEGEAERTKDGKAAEGSHGAAAKAADLSVTLNGLAEPVFGPAEIQEAREKLRDVVFEVASQAHLHREHARQMDLPPDAALAFLPQTWTNLYLDRLEQVADFDPLHPALHADPFAQLRLQGRLLRHRWSRSF